MLATFVTLALIGFAVGRLRDLAHDDGAKIIAALRGRSWAAEPRPTRPVIVRFSSTRRAELPTRQAALSAAA